MEHLSRRLEPGTVWREADSEALAISGDREDLMNTILPAERPLHLKAHVEARPRKGRHQPHVGAAGTSVFRQRYGDRLFELSGRIREERPEEFAQWGLRAIRGPANAPDLDRLARGTQEGEIDRIALDRLPVVDREHVPARIRYAPKIVDPDVVDVQACRTSEIGVAPIDDGACGPDECMLVRFATELGRSPLRAVPPRGVRAEFPP